VAWLLLCALHIRFGGLRRPRLASRDPSVEDSASHRRAH
jgi:hypothetical protein